MKKNTISLVSALVAATIALPAAANTSLDGLNDCAAIASPLDRLECYDALARTMGARPAPPAAVAPPPAPAPTATPAATRTPAPAPAVATAEPPAPAPAPAASPDKSGTTTPPVISNRAEEFGFENERLKKDTTEVVAYYDGEFTGWSGGTLFKLDNGQVWKQSQSGRVYYVKDRPKITIKRGAFGSYRLAVEGLNRTVRVKRVK